MTTSKFEITTTYYDRKSRKEIRYVHGIVDAVDTDSAHAAGVAQYGSAGAKLLGETSSFWQSRAIKVKRIQ